MSKATQTELRLARRMARLGTETAFEVLVRARALEAKGKNIVHLEIGEPDFDTPTNIIDAGIGAHRIPIIRRIHQIKFQAACCIP